MLDLASDVLGFDRTAPRELLVRRRLAICVLQMALRRRSGRFREAEGAYSAAVALLAGAEAGAAERGWLLAALGQLRWVEKRFDEARALLESAAWILYRAEADGAGAVFVLAGLLDVDAVPARARTELELGLAEMDEKVAPALAQAARCAEICCAARAHRWSEATRLVANRGPGVNVMSLASGELAYLLLWDTRVLDSAGYPEGAVKRREDMRGLLLREGSLREAATFTIEILLRRGEKEIKSEAFGSLASDLRAAFGAGAEVERCARQIEALVDLARKRAPVFGDRVRAALGEWTVYDGPDRPDLLAVPPDLADADLISGMLGEVDEVDEADEVEA
jgi:hypothetical protein